MPDYMVYAENARTHLIRDAEGFDPDAPLKERLEVYKTVTIALKMMAYAPLLSFGDIDLFYKRLLCCALNWREFLRGCHAKGETGKVPASLNDGFLCALVCGRHDVAQEIATLSSSRIVPPEYDDEFLAAHFLHTYVLHGADTADSQKKLKAICASMVEYLEKTTAQAAFFNALADGDSALMNETFKDWNTEVAEARDARAHAPGAPYSFELTRHIWLEGLAYVKYLNHKGIYLTGTYRLIPSVALGQAEITMDETQGILGKSTIEERSF